MSLRTYPDVYTIRHPQNTSPTHLTTPTPGQTITYYLQKFHYYDEIQRYQPAFPAQVKLQLLIKDCQLKSHHYRAFPHLLNGYPQSITYQDQTFTDPQDPIVHGLHPLFRMTFRYDSLSGVGCLVHFGYDLGQPEEKTLYPLWLTALNLEELER